jgi:protein-S-isoprenylcysteine O-methyltransferase Ste14
MSAVPAFEIGVWNAWLLMLPLVLIPAILASVKKGLFKKTESTAKLSKAEKMVFRFSKVFLVLLFLYSIFLPLKLGTLWFYVGLPISLLGIVMYIIVSVNIANTQVDRPVTTGLYRYSRHPMYVTSFIAPVGAGIATASWLFLLLSVLCIITHFMNGIFEERLCLEAYGSEYQEYSDRTPRWIGIPKIVKSK